MNRKVALLRQAARGSVYFTLRAQYRRRKRILIAFESLAFALIIFLSVLLQTVFQIKPPTYALSPTVKGLVGESRDDTAQYLKEDKNNQQFTFEVPKSDDNETKVHIGRNADAYSASLPIEAKNGVSFTDSTSLIDIKLTPKFKTYPGQKVEGDHIVYLAHGGVKLIYTLKYNGLKEDIILPHYMGNEVSFDFDLALPSGVDARLDAQGNIGIYSSDPTLFGNISFGSDEDRARVDKARENGEKTNLVATIPFPLIKDANNIEFRDKAKFSLGDKKTISSDSGIDTNIPAELQAQMKTKTIRNVYELNITGEGLREMSYPLSIDPSLQITEADDFGEGNLETGIVNDRSNGLIKRNSLSGGQLDTWVASPNAFTAARYRHGMVVYNNYIYIIAGYSNAYLSDVQYAPINLDGTIGTWQSTSSISSTRSSLTALAYNGYVYVFGGAAGATTATVRNIVEYAKVNSDGTLGSWTTTTSLGTPRYHLEAVAYNNRVYLSGGYAVTGVLNTPTEYNIVEYADFLPDGSISSWTSATNLPTTLYGHTAEIYNGYIYVMGGYSGTILNTVSYAKITDNGSIGSWNTATSLNIGRDFHSSAVMSGYLYVFGGRESGSINSTSTEYAQINADGTVGTWSTSTNLTNNPNASEAEAYNGYIYVTGGENPAGTKFDVIQYTNARPAGWAETWTQQTNQFTNGRQLFGAAVFNGYLYVAGGCGGSCYDPGQTSYNDTQYAPINSDGSIGTWTTAPATGFGGAGRAGIAMTVYNGYLYVSGGFSVDGLGTHTNYNTLFYSQINISTGAPGAWQTATNSPGTLIEHNIVGHGGYLYAFGGRTGGTGVTNAVRYAPLSASTGNTTAAFQNLTSLPVNNSRSSVLQVNGKFYVFGGCSAMTGVNNYTCAGQHDEIYYIDINNDGTLAGSWTTQTDGLAGARYDYGQVTLINGYFYIHGGNGPGSSTVVKYAKLNSDSSVGAWTSTTSTLTVREDQQTVGYNSYFYVVGGSVSRTIDRIYVHNGGQGNITTWSSASNTNSGAKKMHSMVAYDGYLYLAGGCNSTPCTNGLGSQSITNATMSAPIGANGKIGSWTTRTFMNSMRSQFSLVQANGYLYAVGGCSSYSNNSDACNNVLTNVEYARIQGNGVLSAWTLDNTNLIHGSSPGIDGEATVHNDRIYHVLGNQVATVKYTDLNPTTGAISAWNSVTALPSARAGVGMIAVGSYLYVFGGCTNYTNCLTAGNTTNAVLAAQINSDGSLGAWNTVGSLPKASMFFGGAHAINGYVYITGGYGSGIDGTRTIFGAISPGGVGAMNYTAATFGGRTHEAFSAINGRLYTNGGTNGSMINEMLDTPLQSIPRIGSFSRLVDYGSGVKPTKIITRGTKRSNTVVKFNYQTVNNTSSSLTNSQSIDDIEYTGINAQTFNLGTNVTLSRYLSLRYTIDETRSAVFPDSGNETTITDFDVYFTANPGQRLRGGRTFTNGADRGLDAQP